MQFGALSLLLVLGQPSPAPLTDPDVYAVYAAVLESGWPVRVAHATRLLIQESTDTDTLLVGKCYPEGVDITGPWEGALADFKLLTSGIGYWCRDFRSACLRSFPRKTTFKGFSPRAVHSAGTTFTRRTRTQRGS